MKKSVSFLIVFFLSSIMFFSCEEHLTPNTAAPFPFVFWDYDSLHEITVDSSTIPYIITTFDTSFLVHSQHSYMGIYSDSLVYTDYTVTPNKVIGGHYNLISNGGVFITLLPSAIPDTFNYAESTNAIISLSYIINSPKISQSFTEFYVRR
jgi:hypothetical protein